MSEDEHYTGDPIVIQLGESNLITWVSEEDRELVENVAWYAKQAGTKEIPHYYAYRKWKVNNVRGDYFLHNLVWENMMGEPLPKGFLVDHIDGDKLNNMRSNLRLATRSDNEANKKKRRTHGGKAPSSRYKGVSKPKNRNWRATISKDKKQIALGSYETEREAAEAYNKAAIELFGEFAVINEFDDE
jgi:hypothetical protein